MKQLIITAIICLLVACKADEPKAFQIKDTDMISIKPASGITLKVKSQNSTNHLTALEIVKQAHHFSSQNNGVTWDYQFSGKDTVSTIPKLMFWAQYVISIDGTASLQEDLITSTDLVLLKQSGSYPKYTNDTIAYIPNSVLRSSEIEIRKAYANKDIESCYTLFNNAYTFVPITGAEWRQLKAAGQN